jgi:CRP-like cAMP-binding protein
MATQPGPSVRLSGEANNSYALGSFAGTDARASSHALHRTREIVTTHRFALIRQFALFSNVPPGVCEEMLGAAHQRQLSRGQTIHIQGDPVRQVWLLISGSAKVVQFGRNGAEVILRLCGPGELVGTLGLSTKGRHCATARSLCDCTALVWETGVFESVSRRFPILRFNTALILAKQLQDMEERFREISTYRVAARLSREIGRLIDKVGHPDKGAVEISISREELAQLIGTTVFTVSRLLADWDKRGIVAARRGAVLVQDRKALENFSGEAS